jgi:para-nitrobenzyl esterase
MRTLLTAFAVMVCAAGAQAQTAAPATTAAKAAHYSTASTQIGTLLDDPAAKALIEKNIPGMTTNDQIDMARSMTLKDIQQYSPDTITDKVLANLDAEFAKIPAKPAS